MEINPDPPFQRLRRIKQLGFSEFVFPGATHTRLSHSLGAMQMARRMLDVFVENKNEDNHLLMRRATLCAVLLHDIGHGPFSHTFEQLSLVLGKKTNHEEITKKLITETEIADILNGVGEELFKAVVDFFAQEPGGSPYSRIVSGELDADRLDFLIRDRYFAGVRSGSIDLEWLFDSLELQEVHWEDEIKHIFYFNEKGLSVAEDFLTAYSHLYATVYFHKTTRSLEVMVREVLKNVLSSEGLRDRLGSDNELVRYFESDPMTNMNLFLSLDDTSILNTIKTVARDDGFGDASFLAKRFLNRDIFKSFEPPSSDTKFKLNKFKSTLKDKGVEYFLDSPPTKAHKIFLDEDYLNNMFVWDRSKEEPTPLSNKSGIADALIAENRKTSTVRFYFHDEAVRDMAKEIWDSL